MSFLIEKWQNDDQPLTDDKKIVDADRHDINYTLQYML